MEIFDQIRNEVAEYHVGSLAKEAGIAPATLYFWLEGRTKSPHLRTILKVAHVLGYDLELVKRKTQLRKVA